MNWYFASRMRHKEDIDNLVDFLKSSGHSVVYEWSKLGSLKPYEENSEQSSLVAQNISESLKDVDIFVLLTDASGTDMFIELGIVIGNCSADKPTKIYAVGEFNTRSLMHFHPLITRVSTMNEVFLKECPELISNESIPLLKAFHIT